MSIIIDGDLILDVDASTVRSKKSNQNQQNQDAIIDELLEKIESLEVAINDLESSQDPRTTSNLSRPNREGTYEKAGLITNVIIGVVIALFLILLMI